MKLKVLFKAFNVREAFMSGYRPDWCSPSKLEYNCAQLIFTDKQHINPGEEHQCILQPFIPEFWAGKVAINDVLRCMEGPRQVGEAIVQEIIQEIADMCCDIPRGVDHNFCPNCGKDWEPRCKFCDKHKTDHDVSSDGKIRCKFPTPIQKEPTKRVVDQCCYHCGRVVGDHAVAMNKLWCKPPFDTSYKPLSKENK
jgi:hypothetical protein